MSKQTDGRRPRTHLTKAQVRDIVSDLVSQQVESWAGSGVSSFVVRVVSDHGRTPTDGEKDMFLEALAKVISGLKRKVQQPS